MPELNIQLTPCCQLAPPIIVERANLINFPVNNTWIPGLTTFCITGISPFVSCWTARETSLAVTDVGTYTVNVQYERCEDCNQGIKPCTECSPHEECIGCIYQYYNLLDCCTNLPYKNEAGEIIYFQYNGVTSYPAQPKPIDFPSPIIITQIKDEEENIIAEGCFKLNQVLNPNLNDPTINVYYWINSFYTATSVANCAACIICGPCYILTDCRNPLNTIKTKTPALSQYIGQTVVLLGNTDTCYYVTVAEDCEGFGPNVTISTNYETCWDCNPCYKLVDCTDSENIIYSDQDTLGQYINPTKIVRITGSNKCWEVQKSDVCTGPFAYVTVTNQYADCGVCRGCFKLINCEDDTDVIEVIDPNLTQYAGQVVVLKFGEKCYRVVKDPFCEGIEATVQIGQSFQDTATQTACEQCIPAPKPPKLTNERPVRPGYIKPVCPNQCESGCSSCQNNC